MAIEIESHENLGSTVICDICNDDMSHLDVSGGFIFGSKAYCPACARRSLPEIQKYKEEHYIKARCPSTQSFADFVREYRGGDAHITVYKLDSLEDLNQLRGQ